MKRVMMSLAVVAVMTAGALPAQAVWTGASSIRAESFYVPSSDLVLGDWFTVFDGKAGYEDYVMSGYAIAEDFQINLEYQAGILDSDIANLNTYQYPADGAFPPGHTDGSWTKNYSDNEVYVFNIDPAGGLTVYEFDGLVETVDPDIEWTLTAWHQTILAGDIVGNTLRVLPVGTYRPFVADPPVNNVEVFDGSLDTEVLGYRFTGVAGDIGDGSTLEAVLIPEPAGLGLIGLALLAVRKKRN